MSQTGTVTTVYSIGGISFSCKATRTGEMNVGQNVVIPAGKAGAISASGVDGLVTGHGIVGSDLIDIHWSDPSDGTHKCRRGVTVDSAAANAITFDDSPAAEGDALPAEDTQVVVSVQVPIVMAFDGDLLLIIGAKTSQRAMVDFRDSEGSELAVKLTANEGWGWTVDQGVTNPMAADDIVLLNASNGSTTETTLQISGLLDSVA